jgi:drug/metabolite transporter (DMT)-like permease
MIEASGTTAPVLSVTVPFTVPLAACPGNLQENASARKTILHGIFFISLLGIICIIASGRKRHFQKSFPLRRLGALGASALTSRSQPVPKPRAFENSLVITL